MNLNQTIMSDSYESADSSSIEEQLGDEERELI